MYKVDFETINSLVDQVEENINTLIYVRGGNTERQIKVCEQYALDNNYIVVGIARSEEEASRIVIRNNIDILLVTDISRVARNAMRFYEIKQMFDLLGTSIEAVEGAIV